MNEEHDIDNDALIYLSGNKCVYDTIPVSAIEMGVDEVGVALAHTCQKCRAGRSRAYMLVYTILTGHKSFEEGRNDDRLL